MSSTIEYIPIRCRKGKPVKLTAILDDRILYLFDGETCPKCDSYKLQEKFKGDCFAPDTGHWLVTRIVICKKEKVETKEKAVWPAKCELCDQKIGKIVMTFLDDK